MAIVNGASQKEGRAISQPIAKFNITDFSAQLRLFRSVLNISVLLPVIASKCDPQSIEEFWTLSRPTSVKVQKYSGGVIAKFYPEELKGQLQNAIKAYTAIDGKVPNVCKLLASDTTKRYIHLSYVGHYVTTILDNKHLICALKDVLEALTELHKLRWAHRDIRWDNIVCSNEKESFS